MSLFTKFIKFVNLHKKEILFFGLIYLILLVNAVHERYSDEMDNILGGYLITKGKLAYTGFFTHHGPLAYYVAAILTFFSDASFVKFRVLSTVFYLILLGGSFILFKKLVKTFTPSLMFFYIAILAVSATYFWGHMFLADPLSGYFLVPAYGLVLLKLFHNEALVKRDLFFIAFLSALAVINSPTYLYSVFILTVFALYGFLQMHNTQYRFTSLVRRCITFASIFIVPYLIFFLFLLITRTLTDYYFQAIVYNRDYYVYNYPKPVGSSAFNPIRYAIIILDSFLNAYHVLLAGVKNVDFVNPLNVTLALSNFILWVFLYIKRRFTLMLLTFLMIVFANVRSNPLNVKPTDYQAAVYIMLSFFNSAFILVTMKDAMHMIQNYTTRILATGLFVLFVVFWFFTSLFLSMELWRMTFLRYMGRMPLIYDRPQVAGIINDVVPKDRYCWVGPFEFEEMLYLECKLPSRFHIIRRFFELIEPIKAEILSDFAKNKPDVIVYQRRTFGAGVKPEDSFFTAFLEEHYVKLAGIDPTKRYRFKSPSSQDFVFDDDFNFEKTRALNIAAELLRKGYIEETK